MSGCVKYFENDGKNMHFVIIDDDDDKYNEIWDKIKEILNTKFHSMPVNDEKYIKAKVREFNGVIKTNFLGDEIPKESMHYAWIACITIDSVMKMDKKELSPGLSRRVQIQNKENKNAQIHENWIRVRAIIWDWIRVKVGVRIWHWKTAAFLLTVILF